MTIYSAKIDSVFYENKFRLFVNYCQKNEIKTIADLSDFDFSLLLNEPGFGVKKFKDITSKYNDIIRINNNISNDELSYKPKSNNVININKTNYNLPIFFLKLSGISSKNIEIFKQNNYNSLNQFAKFDVNESIKLFGNKKGIDVFKKLNYFEKNIEQIINDFLNDNYNSRDFKVVIDRVNQKTLQEIANQYGLTRERVRQIEARFNKYLSPLIISLINDHMNKTGLKYIKVSEIYSFFSNDEYNAILLYNLKASENFEFLDFAEMFIKKNHSNQNTYDVLYNLTVDLIGEGINFFDNLSLIEEMLDSSGLDFISTESYLNYLIEINAVFYGDFVVLKKLPLSKLYLIIVNKYFKNGINIYSDEDINELRKLIFKEFGNIDLPANNRAISVRLADVLIVCDRGKAVSVENLKFDYSVIEKIKEYIDKSELKTLYFSEIFTHFKEELSITSNINNRYGLHGIFSYLYKNEYDFTRECITKKNMKAPSLNISDRVEILIKNTKKAITRKEIQKNISGLSEIMLFNAVVSNKKLLLWDYNRFNSLENLQISNEDTAILKTLLEEILNDFNGYCSDKLIYNSVCKSMPEFINKNQIENSTNLFYILQKIFETEYEFSRPHICKKNIIDRLNTKNIALYLLNSNHFVSRIEFLNLSKKVLWSTSTSDLIFYEIEKEYIRISEDIYLNSSDFHINNQDLNNITATLNELIQKSNYLSTLNFCEFDCFPVIDYEWNSYLLISIIKQYKLNYKIISPVLKDRRYNKNIITFYDSKYSSLGDIVFDLLVKNNINSIDETHMLKLLISNRLTLKTIPKELYAFSQLNYSDGYFKLKSEQ